VLCYYNYGSVSDHFGPSTFNTYHFISFDLSTSKLGLFDPNYFHICSQ